jgi:hypothetical protein
MMTGRPIADFVPDADRLSVIRECMENYDVGDADAEWPNNIISRWTVVYGSGVIARNGDLVRHAVDPEELALCRRLSDEIAKNMTGVPVGMGSESVSTFHGFFIAGTIGEPVPEGIDESLIRSRFAGTIFPPATVSVEPLVEAGEWWARVEADGAESEVDNCIPWRAMIRWFRERPEFRATAFVRIGDQAALSKLSRNAWPAGTQITGCVLPRLALGLTAGGSLIGLFGHCVET